jgi:hypothetical protein
MIGRRTAHNHQETHIQIVAPLPVDSRLKRALNSINQFENLHR